MSDYSAVAPPSNFTQTSAFAAALQRARQIAAKINPGGGEPGSLKRPLEDSSEPEAKKLAGGGDVVGVSSAAAQAQAQAAAVAARVAAAAAAGLQGLGVGVPGLPLGGQVLNEDVRVPDKMVGLIIGRGGEQISRLQNESGCKIQMAPDSNGMPERACTLTGTREAITRARELIMNIVHQRSRTEGTGGLGDMNMGGAPSNMAHRGRMDGQDDMNMGGAPSNQAHRDRMDSSDEDEMNMNNPPPNSNQAHRGRMDDSGQDNMNMGRGPTGHQAHVEIMVPGPKVGLIIGKGGETIKQLQEKSGAKMVIIQDGPTQEQEKPLRISGEPQKVEYAKQLVYDLIAEKEMQAQQYNQRGGGGGGGRGGGSNHSGFDEYGGDNGGGGGDGVEVLVPRAAVGVVIGKGGDMIKKIQNETGARVQFQQGRDDGPGERRCLLSGKPAQVDQARRRIEELIDSRRDNEMGRGGGRGGRGGGGGGGFDRGMGGGRGGGGEFGNGNPPGGGGWDNRRGPGGMGGGGDKGEATFTIPAAKCGIVIGRGGETIKLINQQTGAHCELDRRPPGNPAEKVFIIRGSQDQIEQAKRIISDKIGMPPGPGGPPPTQYPLGQGGPGGPGGPQGQGPPQHFATPQGWGGGFQQPWQNQQQHPNDPSAGGQVQMNPATGQPDYSAQWAEYYRSLGMMREAEMIEQQSKQGMTGAQAAPQPTPQQAAPQGAGAGAQNGSTPDYSLQWAEYYRSMGKIKEAEAIEAQMKTPKGGAGGQPNPAAGGGQPQQAGQPSYNQPGGYNYQPAPGGYYPNQPGGPGGPQPGQPPAPFNYPSGPGYAYAGQPQDNQ